MIGAIILGILAGYLGRAIMPGRQQMGFFMTTILGVVGALLGFLFFTEVLGIGDSDAFDLGGLPGAVIGVIIVLFIYDRASR
ncbi:MAG TPA: GlsB/YeaQ/YmgE family stress response membrane protein [Solirubrobacterales bacterium]|nr:GlsB/YeaQ/YmgE family stress response membrane protein [Solirubrobacterales bacterium]